MTTNTGPNGRVESTVQNGVAEVHLDDPDRRNAFSPELGEDLLRALLEVGDRDDVSAVALTAEGKAFCAGLDLGVLRGDDDDR
ncbi:MAG: enoyl-CoA hydratase/isomerase family protein, partial [Natronomonas sp.]